MRVFIVVNIAATTFTAPDGPLSLMRAYKVAREYYRKRVVAAAAATVMVMVAWR